MSKEFISDKVNGCLRSDVSVANRCSHPSNRAKRSNVAPSARSFMAFVVTSLSIVQKEAGIKLNSPTPQLIIPCVCVCACKYVRLFEYENLE